MNYSGGRDLPLIERRPSQARRTRLMMFVMLVFVSAYSVRLVDLQVVRASELQSVALNERLTSVVLKAPRGVITDNTGEPLAVSVDAVDVVVDQTLLTDVRDEAAQALAPLLGMSTKDVLLKITGEKRYAKVAGLVEPKVWRKIADLNLPGVIGERTTTRVYPAGELAANIIGFIGTDGNGLGGLEYGLDELLSGTDGRRDYERAPGGRVMPTGTEKLVEPIPGTGIALTINRDIQWVAQRALAQRVKIANADSGTIVVLNPKTGHILAMASVPTFDPNDPTASPIEYRSNLAVTQNFEPGSTAKVMSLSAVMNEGKVNQLSEFTVPNRLKRPGKTFSDHDDHPTLKLTLTGVLAQSSNIGTILASENISGETLYDYYKKFGVAQPTGLGFPGESKGAMLALKDWSKTTFPTMTFGQGISMTQLQAASVFATIANDGVRVSPTLVAGTVDKNGNISASPAPKATRVITAETAVAMREMLEVAVSKEGTGSKGAIPGYRVGGKTGTAQRYEPSCGCYRGYVASFIGMVPAEDPQLVIAVSLDNPRSGHYGGMHGGPVFAEVGTFALQELRIAPSLTQPPKIATTWK